MKTIATVITPRTITIAQWHPTSDASGPPTQVHVILENDPESFMPSMTVRFKSREGLERFVADLLANADAVWPRERE